jgi:hypothetical protein
MQNAKCTLRAVKRLCSLAARRPGGGGGSKGCERLRCESSGGGGGARQSLLDPLLTGEVDDEDEHASDGGGATRHSRAESVRGKLLGECGRKGGLAFYLPPETNSSRGHIYV